MDALYADGRAAVTKPVRFEIGADALAVETESGRLAWPYAELRRADDGNGRIVLRRHPDNGERLILAQDLADALKAAAPALFTPRAQGVEGPMVAGGLAAAALSIAVAFLIGVPLAAEPLARVMPERYQMQLAGIARSQVEGLTEYCENSGEAEYALDDLVIRMIDASPSTEDDAFRDRVTVTLVQAPFPNAFALPDDSIIVTDQLIAAAEQPDEIAGVLAHELAHITHRHVMANVIRNVGAGIFFDVIFGGAGVGQAVAIASVNLASLGYSRADEAEADRAALDYLDAAGINPAALAQFFDRIAQISGEQTASIPTMLSSHPATAERAAAARTRAHPGRGPALSAADWQAVRMACGATPEAQPAQPVPAPSVKPGAAPPPGKPTKPQP